MYQPGEQTTAEAVLSRLEGNPLPEWSSSPNAYGGMETDGYDRLDDTVDDPSALSQSHSGPIFDYSCG